MRDGIELGDVDGLLLGCFEGSADVITDGVDLPTTSRESTFGPPFEDVAVMRTLNEPAGQTMVRLSEP